MIDSKLISVVVPAYNEGANFALGKLERVYNFLRSRKKPFELILVDDGSLDTTLKDLESFAQNKMEVKVLKLNHSGKAITVMKGMLAAKGDVRLFTDFDQSTPIEELENLLIWIEKGYQVVIGSRELAGAQRKNEPWYRHLMGRGFNWLVQLIAVKGIQDTQCGFKMMTKTATEELFPRLKVTTRPKKDAFTGAMDVELLYLAKKYGMKIKEVPVKWKHVASKRVSPIKDSLRMFMEVLKIRMANILGSYAK